MGGRPAERRNSAAPEPPGNRLVCQGPRPGGTRGRKSPVTSDVDFRRAAVTLTARDVAEITRLLEESSFDELYLELDGLKLSLKRGGVTRVAAVAPTGPEGTPSAGPAIGRAPSAPGSSVSQTGRPSAATDPSIQDVTAPLLGT